MGEKDTSLGGRGEGLGRGEKSWGGKGELGRERRVGEGEKGGLRDVLLGELIQSLADIDIRGY